MTPPDTREQARATAHELLSLGPDCMNHWVGDHAACDTMVNYILARDAAHAAEVERLQALLDDGDAALALRFEAAWDAGHGAACADAAFLAASLERETQLRAEVATLTARVKLHIDGHQGAEREIIRLRDRLSTVERERDEARGLLERVVAIDEEGCCQLCGYAVTSERQCSRYGACEAADARRYLSRSPVEGGREMVTPSIGQRWEVIGDDVDPCDRFVLTGLDADGDWTTLDDDGHEGSATVREFNRGDVYRYIGAATPETRDMKTREGT